MFKDNRKKFDKISKNVKYSQMNFQTVYPELSDIDCEYTTGYIEEYINTIEEIRFLISEGKVDVSSHELSLKILKYYVDNYEKGECKNSKYEEFAFRIRKIIFDYEFVDKKLAHI
ncbi:hypothetical protein [Acetobacterium sp.]|uniref:hypothetical protein n=1 Tax=Acetobacterium sp. TaxID=1872094 RepID=UPI00271882E2|nr:hypothetical protein [Acetobacterium sp.]MDO9491410.1 hypothetical protein [Acetobacterium sp.]